MKKSLHRLSVISLCIVLLSLTACKDPFPRQKGYLRIDLEKSKYIDFKQCAFQSKISSIAILKEIPNKDCWFKFSYPDLKADIHFSYVKIDNNFADLVNSVHEIKDRHNQVASYIPEEAISNKDGSANGIQFKIQGKRAASPLNFYLTDSVNHFVTTSLYFNHSPNNDSIQPLIEHIFEDIDTLVYNWKWD
jgi:gliding motility-associated lipoprotein GldD